MSETFFFLSAGLAFVALFVRWMQECAAPVSGSRAALEIQEVFTSARLELPSRELAERIFASCDWDFIAGHTSPDVRRKFLQERKTLAVSWVRQTRNEVGRLMRFHRKAVRGNVRLKPSSEFRLACDYVLFLAMYQLLYRLIQICGPYRMRKIAGYAAGMTEQLSYVSGQLLAGLDPVRLRGIYSN